MLYTSNAPLQTQSNLRSEQTDLYKFNAMPQQALFLRADQWILVEEALMEQAAIQYHISQKHYAINNFDKANHLYDKATELEALAKKVGSVIELLQANSNTQGDQ